jgi:hypothetical protein
MSNVVEFKVKPTAPEKTMIRVRTCMECSNNEFHVAVDSQKLYCSTCIKPVKGFIVSGPLIEESDEI